MKPPMASYLSNWNMSLNSRFFLVFAGISGFIAVLMGAAATHWLAASLAPEDISRIEKAATYQMYHTLALLGLGVWMHLEPQCRLKLPASLFAVGILLFCGSLYAYSVLHLQPLVYVTPLGGTAMMAGWLSLAVAAFKR